MAKNKNNLVSIGDRTTEEQREITSKGGKASGAARRRKKTMKDTMLYFLSQPAAVSKEFYKTINPDAIETNMDAVVASLLNVAIAGDVQAVKELRSIIRDDERLKLEKERVKIEQAYLKMKQSGDQSSLDKLDELLSQFLDGD